MRSRLRGIGKRHAGFLTEMKTNRIAWLTVYSLRPKVIHCGTPCTKMCLLGSRQLDEMTVKLNEFTRKVAEYQHSQKLGVSIENPKGSFLFQQPAFEKTFGMMSKPKAGWMFYRPEGHQFHVQYPGPTLRVNLSRRLWYG